MRTRNLFISFIYIAFLVACNSAQNNKKASESSKIQKSEENKLTGSLDKQLNSSDSAYFDINEESANLDKFLKDKVGDAAKAKALPIYAQDSLSAIYAVCTNKIDTYFLRKKGNNAQEKNIIHVNGLLRDSISLFVDGKKIFSLEKRTLQNNQVLSHDIFIFGDNNDCIGRSTHKKEWNNSFQDAIYNDTIVRSDIKEKIILINRLEKQQIIQSAKASLDSMMQHFPEFKYSFNWK
jgi:hypothetical protein